MTGKQTLPYEPESHATTQQNSCCSEQQTQPVTGHHDTDQKYTYFPNPELDICVRIAAQKLQLQQTNSGHNTGRSLAVQLRYGCLGFFIFHDDCRL